MPDMDDLAEEITQQPTETKSPFVVDNDSKADWAMRKIAEARKNTAMWEAHFRAQMDAIRKEGEETEAYFTALLLDYFRAQPKHETKTQAKYKLPSGDLVLKRQQPEYQRDDTKLVECLMHGDLSQYVKLTPSVDWSALKAACTVTEDGALVDQDSGLVLDGVRAVPRPDKFEVMINGA